PDKSDGPVSVRLVSEISGDRPETVAHHLTESRNKAYEDFIRLCSGGGRVSEVRIVPLEQLWRNPLRPSLVACIFHNDSHPMFPVIIGEITHNPDSRMV